MSTTGAVFQLGHLIARNRASEAGSALRSPSLPSPHGSYTTSAFGRAELTQAVLFAICSWSAASRALRYRGALHTPRLIS